MIRLDNLNEAVPVVCNTGDQTIFSNMESACSSGLPLLSISDAHKGKALIVGGGPSMRGLLPTIKARQEAGEIVFALNGVLPVLKDAGVTPDYFVLLDAREDSAGFINDAPQGIKYLIASQCHVSAFDKLKDEDVMVWMPNYPGAAEYVTDVECAMIGGGTTVGLQAMGIAYALGFREVHLYGFDSSYQDGEGHAYKQSLNDFDQREEYVAAGKSFMSTPWMVRQVMEFQEASQQLADGGCEIHVHGNGLLPTVAKEITRLKEEVDGGTLTLGYDLNKYPASWDYMQWLLQAEMYREAVGYDKLRVCITNGYRNDGLPTDKEYRNDMVENVIKPATELIGATITDETPADIVFSYTMAPIVDMVRNGAKMAKFKALPEDLDRIPYDYNYVTVTLRECDHWPKRNSNIPAWKAFARDCGYPVVFVRDTSKADEPLDGFVTDPTASKDVKYRMALYEKAVMNMFVSNGPLTLAVNSNVNWIGFGGLCEGYLPNTPGWWEKNCGIKAGGQYPWSHRFQHYAWVDDDPPNIMNVFNEVMGQSPYLM